MPETRAQLIDGKAMAAETAERYSSAQQLGREVESFLAGERVLALPAVVHLLGQRPGVPDHDQRLARGLFIDFHGHLKGSQEFGIFGGPALGGIVGTAFGLQASFILTGVMALLAWVAAFLFVPGDGDVSVRPRGGAARRWKIVRETVREHAGDETQGGRAFAHGCVRRTGV